MGEMPKLRHAQGAEPPADNGKERRAQANQHLFHMML